MAVLENSGIEAVVRGEHMGGLPVGIDSRPSVWVRDEDYDAACELLGVSKTPVDPAWPNPSIWVLVAVILALSLMIVFGR